MKTTCGRVDSILIAPAMVFAVVLAAAAFVSCWVPPYDPAISASAHFENKLEHLTTLGPLEFQNLDSGTDYFMPSFEARPSDGYWIRRSAETNLAVRYISGASGKAYMGPSLWRNPNFFGDLNAIASLSQASAIGVGADTGKGLLVFGDGIQGSFSSSESVFGVGVISAYSSWSPGISATLSSIPSYALYPKGGNWRYSSSVNRWLDYGLIFEGYDAGTSKTTLSYTNLNAIDLTFSYSPPTLSLVTIPYAGPSLEPGASFIYCSLGSNPHYILSGRSSADGRSVGFRWESSLTLAPTLVVFDAQVTDVLSDDTLVARGPDVTKYFDSEGNSLFDLPTGAIRYVFEYNDGGTWYSYFTRTLSIYGNDTSSGQLLIDIYRYPSADLSTLAN